MADPRLRQLATKTTVVKFLTNELVIYESKVLTENKHMVKLLKESADAYKLHEEQQLGLGYLGLLLDTSKRLQSEYEMLGKFVSDEKDLEYAQEYKDATKVLNDTKKVLANDIYLQLV